VIREARLLAEGLVEKIQCRGSLPMWRRDGDNAYTLRITKRGLHAIRVDDEAIAAAKLKAAQPRAGSKQANRIGTLDRRSATASSPRSLGNIWQVVLPAGDRAGKCGSENGC
jgi:hypothetical protein